MSEKPQIYGLLAEFPHVDRLVRACRATREAGYRNMDAYTPFPSEEVIEALGFRRTRLPLLVLIGGLIGCLGGFALQSYAMGVSYPLNVGGRALWSWPAFIPVTFELTVLAAAGTAVLGMLALNGLPQPYHPLFHIERFASASRDRLFLCIEARDPLFDVAKTRQFLESLEPTYCTEVPR